MEKYSELKEGGVTIEEYIKQGSLFGADTSPLQTRVMQVFDSYKRRSKSIRGIIDNYIAASEALGDPNQQSLFGAGEIPSKESIFEGAVRTYEQEDTGGEDTAEQVGLFDPNQRRENQPETRSQDNGTIEAIAEEEVNSTEKVNGLPAPAPAAAKADAVGQPSNEKTGQISAQQTGAAPGESAGGRES